MTRGSYKKVLSFLQDKAPAERSGKTMDVFKNIAFEGIVYLVCLQDVLADHSLFLNLKTVILAVSL